MTRVPNINPTFAKNMTPEDEKRHKFARLKHEITTLTQFDADNDKKDRLAEMREERARRREAMKAGRDVE